MQKYKYLYVNGDSYTFGLDLEYQSGIPRFKTHSKHRWSNLLSERLDCREVNQAKCGSSNDRIVRTLFDWYINNEDKHKDTFVVIGWTVPYRFEHFVKDEWKQEQAGHGWVSPATKVMGGFTFDNPDSFKEPGEHKPLSDEMYKRDFRNHVLLIQNFLKINNIEYLFFIVHDDGITNSLEDLKNNPLLDFENIIDISFNDFSENIQNEKIWGYRHPNRLSHKLWAKKLYDKIRQK